MKPSTFSFSIVRTVVRTRMLRLACVSVNLFVMLCTVAHADGAILTNSVHFKHPPAWLTERMVDRATGPVQEFLQWDTRRIQAFWHGDAGTFAQMHSMGPEVRAFFRRADGSVHLGPAVNVQNFEAIFRHEMVHAIVHQKYRGSVPAWLEEGLACFLSRTSTVDYAWLSEQPFIDVRTLSHPTQDATGSRFHYQTSTALVQMIASKCDLSELIALSVGRKLDPFLATFCEIPDLNAAFQKWIREKAASK